MYGFTSPRHLKKKYVDATVHKDYKLAPDSNPRLKKYSNHFKHELLKKQPKVANMFQDHKLCWIHIQYQHISLFLAMDHVSIPLLKKNTHTFTWEVWQQIPDPWRPCFPHVDPTGACEPIKWLAIALDDATALVQEIRGVLKGSLSTIELCLGLSLSSALFLGREWHWGVTFGFSWHRFWCHQKGPERWFSWPWLHLGNLQHDKI